MDGSIDTYVIFNLVYTMFFFVGCTAYVGIALRYRQRIMVWWALGWLCSVVAMLFYLGGVETRSMLMVQVSYTIFTPCWLLAVLCFHDYSLHDTLDARALAIVLLYACFLAFLNFSSFFPVQDVSTMLSPSAIVNPRAFFNEITYIMIGTVYLSWGWRMHRQAPEHMKIKSRWVFTSTVLAMGGFLGDLLDWPGIIVEPAYTIAMILFLVILLRDPRVLFIIPFQAIRVVVCTTTGLPCFQHQWRATGQDKDLTLASGMLVAVQSLSEHGSGFGRVREVKLDEGSLIVVSGVDYIAGLVTRRVNASLRAMLERFTKGFEQAFPNPPDVVNSIMFEPARHLVATHFAPVPPGPDDTPRKQE